MGGAFVEHQLALNDIYCALKFGEIPLPGVTFRRWVSSDVPLASSLLPDGYLELVTPEGLLRPSSKWTLAPSGAHLGRQGSEISPVRRLRRIRAALRPEPLPRARHRELRAPDAFDPEDRRGRSRKRSSGFRRSIRSAMAGSSKSLAPAHGRRTRAAFQGTPMKYCYHCGRLTSGEPLFCQFCGRSYDVKLCPRLHANPRARFARSAAAGSSPRPSRKFPAGGRVLEFLLRILFGIILVYLSLSLLVALLKSPMVQAGLVRLGLLLLVLWALWMMLPDWFRKFVHGRVMRKESKHER